MVEMEYDVLAKFLVDKKGYDYKCMYQPLSEVDIDFFQRGLILDFERGNVLQVSEDGIILQASHGTEQLSSEEICMRYGDERQWDVTSALCKDMVVVLNSPLMKQMRTLLDYFDMPASLAFARAVNCTDYRKGQSKVSYTAGQDVLEALIDMYSREHFTSEKSGYFKELKANPDKYINKCKPQVLDWLKTIKKEKPVILITGSNVDYASFSASYCLGEDWLNYFDVVVCYARKPGFFTETRPFLRLEGILEREELNETELDFGGVYSQGNWKDLERLVSRKTNKDDPKCLYIGDNLVQDIFAPSKYAGIDAVAVVEELGAEAADLPHHSGLNPNRSCVASRRWGSFFRHMNAKTYTMWGGIIKNYAKICVPNLSTLASYPLNYELDQFEVENKKETEGYHPTCPMSLRAIRYQLKI
ncbi:hypothetical protein AAG570_008985 [Ranatra chinensis]|uniref:5'-nucleotidase domain-containing protein 1 n=1 Tax=Ranatra chinensis TaxID=642074 RepID=A0ABD0ZDM5_9HEMI